MFITILSKLYIFSCCSNLFSDRLYCHAKQTVPHYGSIKWKTSLSTVCTFGMGYLTDAHNQEQPQKLLTCMQSSYRPR